MSDHISDVNKFREVKEFIEAEIEKATKKAAADKSKPAVWFAGGWRGNIIRMHTTFGPILWFWLGALVMVKLMK